MDIHINHFFSDSSLLLWIWILYNHIPFKWIDQTIPKYLNFDLTYKGISMNTHTQKNSTKKLRFFSHTIKHLWMNSTGFVFGWWVIWLSSSSHNDLSDIYILKATTNHHLFFHAKFDWHTFSCHHFYQNLNDMWITQLWSMWIILL